MSYMVGFGKRYPEHVHHKGSSLPSIRAHPERIACGDGFQYLYSSSPNPWYLIPKGWKIYVYMREANYDPFQYPEPITFNPWRWEDKNMEYQSHFMLFGGGTRLCPGKEIGLVEISTFLHYFMTRYSWEEIEGQCLEKFPRVQAPNGLHIKVSDN